MAATRQARRRQQRVAQRRGRPVRNVTPWYLRPFTLALTAVVVAAVIIIIIAYKPGASSTNASFTRTPASPSVLAAVEHPTQSQLAAVGGGNVGDPWFALKGHPKPLTKDGKPELFFWGAEFCPICATERWGMINALSRFGRFTGIEYMESNPTDIFPDTNTFTFLHAHYSSRYLSFVPVEAETRARTVLQNPSAAESKLVATYDAPPYVSAQSAGGFPFLDLANRASAGLPPNDNEGYLHTDPANMNSSALSWNQIASDLKSPTSLQSAAVYGNGNWLTAGICRVTKNKPASVCMAAPIPGLERQLPFK